MNAKTEIDFDLVEHAEIGVRARNCLKNMDILRWSEAKNYSPLDFLRSPNFGDKSVSEIVYQIMLRYPEYNSGKTKTLSGVKQGQLNIERNREIWKARMSGMTFRDIARKYSLGHDRVRQILCRIERENARLGRSEP